MSQPHNLVRHPDMPKEAFANLRETIKAGRPWNGMVKNRRKDGGFYWVSANVTPVIENGETAGYISIRTRPTREAIAAADRAYADIRAGKSTLTLADGELRPADRRPAGLRPAGLRAGIADVVRSITGRLAIAFAIMIAFTRYTTTAPSPPASLPRSMTSCTKTPPWPATSRPAPPPR